MILDWYRWILGRFGKKNPKRMRLYLFWLVAFVGTLGPWACAKKQDIDRWYDVTFDKQTPTSPTPSPVRDAELCNVESVYDGDTAWLVCAGQREKIRLYCIDAPEMQQPPWGKMSRDYLRSIMPAQIMLERMDTDRYGRTVGRLLTPNGDDANLAMVRTGNAVVYPKYCPRSEGSYYRAERHARDNASGVWSVAGDQSAPWKWRNP